MTRNLQFCHYYVKNSREMAHPENKERSREVVRTDKRGLHDQIGFLYVPIGAHTHPCATCQTFYVQELYVSSTKRQKMSISRSIVEAVRQLDPPGRFLEQDPSTGLWADIGHKKAVEKTSQALRDGAASLRKQLSADLGDPEFLNAVFDDDPNEEVDVKGASSKKSISEEVVNDGKSIFDDSRDPSISFSKGKKMGDKIRVAKVS